MTGFLRKYNIFTRTSPYAKDFYVLSSSSSLYGELSTNITPDYDGVSRLFTSIADALDACVASRGDVIHVLPGHAETITAAIDVDVAGVSIVGEGRGSLRPTITVNGAVDGLNISAASVSVSGLHFAAPETDEATAMINVSGAGVTISDITGIGSQTSKNFVDCITIASGANDLTISNVKIYNSVVAVNSFLSIEAAVARLSLIDIRFFGDVATAGIIDAAAATHVFLENVRVAVVGTTKPAVTLDSNPTGMARNCFFSGTSTTLATNANLGNVMRSDNIKVLEETNNSASAAIIPAVDTD
jgi:hypothetical protein